jgi:hypothetical protein
MQTRAVVQRLVRPSISMHWLKIARVTTIHLYTNTAHAVPRLATVWTQARISPAQYDRDILLVYMHSVHNCQPVQLFCTSFATSNNFRHQYLYWVIDTWMILVQAFKLAHINRHKYNIHKTQHSDVNSAKIATQFRSLYIGKSTGDRKLARRVHMHLFIGLASAA